MKKVIGVVLAVAILAAVGVALVWKGREVKVGGAENFIPENALVYISQKGIGKDWEKFKSSHFWKEETSLKEWREIEPQLKELQRKIESKVGFALNEGNVKQLFGKEVALALLPGQAGNLKPRGLLLTRVGMKTKVQEHLAKIEDKLSGQGKLPSETYKDVEITSLKLSSPGIELSYAFLNDWLVLGIGRNNSVLKEVIDIYRDRSRSLANNENFQEIRSRVPKERAGLFYLNMEEALAVYPEKLIGEIPKGRPSLKEMGRQMKASLEMVKTVGGATWFDKGLKAKLCLLLNRKKADGNLQEMYSWKPRKFESLKYIPQGTLIYAAGSVDDMGTYWKYLRGTLKKQNPQVAEQMLRGVEKLKTKWGISLEDDILSWMGPELAYGLAGVNLEGMFPRPGYFLLLQVRDEKKARETLDKVGSIMEKISVKKGLPSPLKFRGEEYEGEEIKVLPVPFLKPGYAFVNNFLIISLSTSTIKKLIDTEKGKEGSLREDANFKRVESIFGEKSNGLSYLNIEKTLDTVHGLSAWFLSAQEKQLSRMKGRKAVLESRKFETPEDKKRAIEAFRKKLSMREKRVSTLRGSLEERVYPLLKSLKVFKSLGVNAFTDKEGAEQTFYLAVEGG